MKRIKNLLKRIIENKYELIPVALFAFSSYFECIGKHDGYLYTLLFFTYILIATALQLQNKINKNEYSLNGILFMASLGSVTISPIISSFVSVLQNTYKNHSSCLYYTVFLFFIHLVSTQIAWKYLFKKGLYNHIIYLRIIILSIDIILLVQYLCCFYLYVIDQGSLEPKSIYDVAHIFCAIAFIWSLIWFIISMGENIKYSFIKEKEENKRFVLFLRCFKFDKNNIYEDIIFNLSSVFKKEYNILQIGNPKNILKGFHMCDTYYLPSTDWQKAVKKYIQNASIIFIVLDETNGVLWEMLHHTDEKDKYLYYLPSNMDINRLMSNETFINEYNNGNPIAAEIKQWHKEIAENTFFFYKDGNLYHSDNIFTILTEYALKYNIHHKEEIVYKSWKYKFDPPYRIKDINWFAAIINGDFYSAYKILENKHLMKDKKR